MLKDFSLQAFFMGWLVAFVGFASSFAVILQGLNAVGATQQQAASGLMALSISMGICGIILSVWTKMPVSAAWSTPGAALLATAAVPEGGFATAVGAFLIAGVLLAFAGIWKPLGRAVQAIPAPLANAMLAGILIGLCFAPFKAVAFDPLLGLPILIAWLIGGRIHRFLAVPAALAAFFVVLLFAVDLPDNMRSELGEALVPAWIFIWPNFKLSALIGIAIPLFIVTMASQNIPGAAVLSVHGYKPQPGPLFAVSGVFSFLSAPFGGHAVNLAAITAAMCASEDAHPDPARRYWSAITAGAVYIFFGLLAGVATSFISLAPGILIEAVAGLALIGAFSASALAAFQQGETRQAAAVTFLTTASGISLLGISGAFWGLLAGIAVLALQRRTPAVKG
uniref:benzoate/H(+) symporter BenE family transporter n=1 Tax=Pararhizobium sp. IMCC3301 TaxID=3067904 RepID=UPI002741BAAA|nr:benzoate/H(+) symporter BenE family transporter [Pararhizobium sp. IMCC3301]